MPIGQPDKTKRRPLSPHAIQVMERLFTAGPMPRQEINSGVVDKLDRENFIEVYDAPTPYKTRSGSIQWVRLSSEGNYFMGASHEYLADETDE